MPTPDYANMHSWDMYSGDFEVEYLQLLDEGRTVEKFHSMMEQVVERPPSPERETMADALSGLMFMEPVREGYAFNEPSTLAEIQDCRQPANAAPLPVANKNELENKVRGAWLGRIAGCLLGKPLEGIRTHELDYVLKQTGNFPMRRYILSHELTDEICNEIKYNLRGKCWADTVDRAPVDDDTNYTVLSADKIIKRYGRGFTPKDVLTAWLDSQPKYAYCTAERVAFINAVNGFAPPDSATHKNKYREWIGAQIRTDYYGYINPGNPETAADFAWRDASVSHVKNGIYGAMFVSAMLAAAAVCNDMKAVILHGLAEIPVKSRLYVQVNEILSMYEAGKTANECITFIQQRYDENNAHHWCHTISNALIVVTALLYGEKDFGKSICLAVGAGFDTDCNGATVGSVVGMVVGADKIPAEWTKPFNGLLDTSIFGVGTISVDDLVKLTMEHMK